MLRLRRPEDVPVPRPRHQPETRVRSLPETGRQVKRAPRCRTVDVDGTAMSIRADGPLTPRDVAALAEFAAYLRSQASPNAPRREETPDE